MDRLVFSVAFSIYWYCMKASWAVLGVLIIILAIGAGYFGYTFFGTPKVTPSPVPQATQINTGAVSFTGTMESLNNLPGDTFADPDGPPSALKTDNGNFYLLVGDKVDANLLAPGQKVSVTGTFDPSITIAHYQINGVIRVATMKAL